MNEAPTKAKAEAYLKSLLNKTLRIHVTDGRMFVGTFKCTDTVSLLLRTDMREKGRLIRW